MYISTMPKCDCSTKIIPAICAWTIIISCTSLYFVFVCRYLTETYSYAFPVVQGVIYLYVMLNLYLSTFMDPGIFPRAPDDEAKDDDFRSPLYKNIEIKGVQTRMKWCTTCQFYRPPRSSHCSSCDNCIETFDHHCPWLNNCIGRRNYRYFISLLISLCIHMVTVLSQCVFYALKHNDDLLRPGPIISIVVMIIIVLGSIPVFGLTCFHMFLISRGATTNEQVTGKFKGGPNPFSKGCFKNCCNVFCGPRWPKLMGYIPKTRTVKLDSSKITYMAAENDVNINVGANSNGIRPVGTNNHISRPRSIHEHDEYLDKGSLSYDCEASPPIKYRQGGSYTNLFDSGSHQNSQTMSVGASIHSNHSKRTTTTPPNLRPAHSKSSTFDRSKSKPELYSTQNGGGGYGHRQAPIVSEEDDVFDAQGQGLNSDTSIIHSPSGSRRYSGGSGTLADRHLPPRGPSSKSTPRLSSPKDGNLPPPSPAPSSQRSESRFGRPPHSPTQSGHGSGGRDTGYSTLPSSSSAVKDRARNFYPSRSRENLNKSREYLNRSHDSLQSGEPASHSLDRLAGSTDRLNKARNKSQTSLGPGATGSLRTFGQDGDSGPAMPTSNSYNTPHHHSRGMRATSRDYIADSDATSVATSEASQGYFKGKPYRENDSHASEPHSSRPPNWDNSDRSLRSAEPRSRDVHSSRDLERRRERDRSKSFDFDPPNERPREKKSSRERSLPRNLSESSHPGYPEPSASSHLRSDAGHTPPSLSGHKPHLPGYTPGRPDGGASSTGSNSLRSAMGHHHNSSSSIPVAGSYNSSPSVYSSSSSRHPSQASSKGYHSQHEPGRPMSFVRAMQVSTVADTRDPRAKRRQQSQSSSRKENTKSLYDTYEASV